MSDLVRLTEVTLRPKIVDSMHTEYTVIDRAPVWVSALGVNLVSVHLDAGVTAILMDCGTLIHVREPVDQVANLIDQSNREELLCETCRSTT